MTTNRRQQRLEKHIFELGNAEILDFISNVYIYP